MSGELTHVAQSRKLRRHRSQQRPLQRLGLPVARVGTDEGEPRDTRDAGQRRDEKVAGVADLRYSAYPTR